MQCELILDLCSNWQHGSNPKQRALDLIELGADSLKGNRGAIKFQLFKADKLYRDKSKQQSVYPYELPIDWLPELKSHAEKCGVEFMCTPFYLEAVDILEQLGVRRHKIAGWDILHEPLVKAIGQTKKPVIMSTTAATFEEIEQSIEWLRPNEDDLRNVTLLHCNASYPSPLGDVMLKRIVDLASDFYPIKVGFSSHITELHIIASTVLYGAETIEVHFTDEARNGIEAAHSLIPGEVNKLITMIEQFEVAKDCGCVSPLNDVLGRQKYYRDPSDWLRPPLD